ncbi:unnamed protein product [Strongylus vulgaris]|uniref:SH3 domain-containing protein n=1 Tax=Strongylus vulgaris TaxID=40348 RepID=A0A3P7IDX1_STRVU|nr:unnamed protein product [Strongylus vulgaris]
MQAKTKADTNPSNVETQQQVKHEDSMFVALASLKATEAGDLSISEGEKLDIIQTRSKFSPLHICTSTGSLKQATFQGRWLVDGKKREW